MPKLLKVHRQKIIHMARLVTLGGFSLLGPLAGGACVIWFAPHLTPASLESLPWISNELFVVMIAALGTLLVGFALLPSIVFAGYLGFVGGDTVLPVACTVIAVGAATLIGIGIFRNVSKSVTESILAFRPSWLKEFKRIQSQHGRGMLAMIFLARLSPHMPFAATNLMIAQLKIPLITATFVSWLGLLPRSILAVAVGSQMKEVHQLGDIAGFRWGGLATLLLVALVAFWFIRVWVVPRLNRSIS